jgi:two-component system copper resistance phosphate regulon response regulator CusR
VKVLVIEDERKTAAYLQRGLGEQGHVVDAAHDGLDGRHATPVHDHDVIVPDAMLPGIDRFR